MTTGRTSSRLATCSGVRLIFKEGDVDCVKERGSLLVNEIQEPCLTILMLTFALLSILLLLNIILFSRFQTISSPSNGTIWINQLVEHREPVHVRSEGTTHFLIKARQKWKTSRLNNHGAQIQTRHKICQLRYPKVVEEAHSDTIFPNLKRGTSLGNHFGASGWFHCFNPKAAS